MEQYQKLADTTRNLEQQYVQQLVSKCNSIIADLSLQGSTLQSKAQTNSFTEETNRKYDDAKKRCLEFEKRVLELTKEKETLEKRQKSLEEKPKINEKKQNEDTSRILAEMHTKHEETIKLVNQLIKKLGEITKTPIESKSKIATEYQSRIKALEDELEEAKLRNSNLQKNEKEHKDNIILLKDTLEEKEKLIKKQKAQLENLKKEIDPLAPNKEGEMFLSEIPSEFTLGQKDPWALQKAPVAKKQQRTKNIKDNKKVNVGNLIRDENKSFFNDLSFSNSSPVVNKTFKKDFK
ncbi:hypothetical protein GINT2_001317 [Glugoides intestinalis]